MDGGRVFICFRGALWYNLLDMNFTGEVSSAGR